MPFDAFLKVDEIPGESPDDRHKGEIEVRSFAWGLAEPLGADSGDGKVVRPQMSDLRIVAGVSKASPKLMEYCANGKHVASAVLTIRGTGDERLEYYVVKLRDVVISSYQSGGSSGESEPTDEVSLNFTGLEFAYTEQKEDGSAGSTTTAAWDVKKQSSA